MGKQSQSRLTPGHGIQRHLSSAGPSASRCDSPSSVDDRAETPEHNRSSSINRQALGTTAASERLRSIVNGCQQSVDSGTSLIEEFNDLGIIGEVGDVLGSADESVLAGPQPFD